MTSELVTESQLGEVQMKPPIVITYCDRFSIPIWRSNKLVVTDYSIQSLDYLNFEVLVGACVHVCKEQIFF